MSRRLDHAVGLLERSLVGTRTVLGLVEPGDLGTFLGKVPSIREVSAIALYNSGVKLLAPGSPVLSELTMLEENGVDLLPCGTCVNHYGVELATGEISTMDQIVQELDKAEKVITL